MPNSKVKGSPTILSIGEGCVTKPVSNPFALFTIGQSKLGMETLADEIAKRVQTFKRLRKFKHGAYVASGVYFAGHGALHEQSYHLENCRMLYIKNTGVRISNKALHNQIAKPEMLGLCKECTEQMLAAIKDKAKMFQSILVPASMKAIQNAWGVRAVFAYDGSQVTLREGAKANLPCKAPGHPKADGSPAAPGIKLDVLYNVSSTCIERIDITEAVADEREHMHLEMLRDCLLLADRGLVSAEWEHAMYEAGVKFIFKGKANIATETVIEAYDGKGNPLPDLIGKRYGDAKELFPEGDLDVLVRNSYGDLIRIVRQENPNQASARDGSKSDNQQFVYLRTNLLRDKAELWQLFEAYRWRWNVEFCYMMLQQGDALQSINSGKKEIILEFILFNLMAWMAKCYVALCALIKAKKDLFHISMIKVHMKHLVFDDLLRGLGRVGKSRMYDLIKKSIKDILEYCVRSHASQRDIDKGKNYPALTAKIAAGVAA